MQKSDRVIGVVYVYMYMYVDDSVAVAGARVMFQLAVAVDTAAQVVMYLLQHYLLLLVPGACYLWLYFPPICAHVLYL